MCVWTTVSLCPGALVEGLRASPTIGPASQPTSGCGLLIGEGTDGFEGASPPTRIAWVRGMIDRRRVEQFHVNDRALARL